MSTAVNIDSFNFSNLESTQSTSATTNLTTSSGCCGGRRVCCNNNWPHLTNLFIAALGAAAGGAFMLGLGDKRIMNYTLIGESAFFIVSSLFSLACSNKPTVIIESTTDIALTKQSSITNIEKTPTTKLFGKASELQRQIRALEDILIQMHITFGDKVTQFQEGQRSLQETAERSKRLLQVLQDNGAIMSSQGSSKTTTMERMTEKHLDLGYAELQTMIEETKELLNTLSPTLTKIAQKKEEMLSQLSELKHNQNKTDVICAEVKE